ncbi:MAG: PHP domain-containing protein [Parcubacteria group bacterium]|jgi:hypothetical protein
MIAMHLHSHHSDGKDSVKELVKVLNIAKVKGAILSDHDNVGGVEEFRTRTKKAGIESIPGFELSTCYEENYYIHILAYGFDLEKMDLVKKGLERNCQAHNECFEEAISDANKHFELNLTTKLIRQATNRAGHTNFTFPLFRYLIERIGLPPEIVGRTIFGQNSPMRKLLSSGKLMTVEEGMTFIKEIGATPVLAHPGFFAEYSISQKGTEKQLEELFETLIDLGLKGAEYYYPYPDKPEIQFFASVAKRLIDKNNNLWRLSGSDYHGAYKTNSCGIAMPGVSLEKFRGFKKFCEG